MTGAALPQDWHPSRDDVEYGLALGIQAPQIYDLAEDMRLWAGANSNRAVGRKANWSMAFKGWMRREMKNGRQRSTQLRRGASVLDAFDRLERRLTGADDHAVRTDDLLSLPSR